MCNVDVVITRTPPKQNHGALVVGIVAFATAVLLASGVWAQTPKLYLGSSYGCVDRMNLDGSELEAVGCAPIQLQPLNDIVLDEAHGRVYATGGGGILGGDIDGGDLTFVLSSAGMPWGIDLDAVNGVLYFTDFASGALRRVNVDGTGFAVIPGAVGASLGVAVDSGSQQIYFTGGVGIQRVNADGTDPTLITATYGFAWSIAVDPAGGFLYWLEDGGGGPTDGKVRRADLDGANAVDLVTGLHSVFGSLAIDPVEGKLYWSEFGGPASRAGLDGSAREVIADLDANGFSPCSSCPPIDPCKLTRTCAASVAQKGWLVLKNKSPDGGDQVQWKWVNAALLSKTAFGSPTTTSDYAFCVYDATGVKLKARAPEAGVCVAKPCWKENRVGFTYGDRELTPNGLQKITLKEGNVGKGKLQVKGRGMNLAMPELSLVLPVRARLLHDGGCWETTFSNPANVSKNDAAGFNAKSD